MLYRRHPSAPTRSPSLRAPAYDRFQPVSPRSQDLPRLMKGHTICPLITPIRFPEAYDPVSVARTLFRSALMRAANRIEQAFVDAHLLLYAIIHAHAYLEYLKRHGRVNATSSPT